MTNQVEKDWQRLVDEVNGRTRVGDVHVRDPEYPCEMFDAQGYDGKGSCYSDGHYMCTECSHLSPESPRFTDYGVDGRRDRLLLFWSRKKQ